MRNGRVRVIYLDGLDLATLAPKALARCPWAERHRRKEAASTQVMSVLRQDHSQWQPMLDGLWNWNGAPLGGPEHLLPRGVVQGIAAQGIAAPCAALVLVPQSFGCVTDFWGKHLIAPRLSLLGLNVEGMELCPVEHDRYDRAVGFDR